jgi:hypothetical protein
MEMDATTGCVVSVYATQYMIRDWVLSNCVQVLKNRRFLPSRPLGKAHPSGWLAAAWPVAANTVGPPLYRYFAGGCAT